MTDTQNTPNVYFDAVLRPNRSLSDPGFTIFMTIVGILSFISGMMFLSVGALPVVGFFGLDALGIWLAFRICFRTQRQWTRVRVTAECLRVDHCNPKGDASHIELPTAFARVELAEPLTHNSWLTLASKQDAYVIGRFLTTDERHSLAEAMRSALRRARTERYVVPEGV